MQAPKRRRVELDPRRDYLHGSTIPMCASQHHAIHTSPTPGYGNNAGSGPNLPAETANYMSLEPSAPASASTSLIAGPGYHRPDATPEALTSTSHQASDQQQQQQPSSWDGAPHHHYPSAVYPNGATFADERRQPYFDAQGYGTSCTDPRTYNSPWPPQSSSFSLENSANQDAGLAGAPPNEMPYLGASETGLLGADVGFDGRVDASRRDVETVADYAYGVDGLTIELPGNDPSQMTSDDASMQLKNQSLSILDNLATQLIQTIARVSLAQIQETTDSGECEEGQAYATLKSLFEQTRKVYSRDTPFIDAVAIQMLQPHQQETIRKANIATFISSILGAHDLSFFHLNEFFLETFVPLGHRLLKWQGAMYLELKTQAYISALMNSDGAPDAMLDELFPPDLDAQILTRHPDSPSLSPSEQDFLERCKQRKSYLLAEGVAEAALAELPKKYQWTEFVREFANCISKNVEAILNASMRTQNPSLERRNTLTTSASNTASQNAVPATTTPAPDISTTAAKTATTAPTANRQPWTKTEEDALLAGLDRVRGPHWSQILALYGRGGSVSEVLKDRNQVQLKDKARNLKLGYLKMGKEVPEALRGVTGELRKRGGKGARAMFAAEAEEEEKERRKARRGS